MFISFLLFFKNCNIETQNESLYRCTLTRTTSSWSSRVQTAFFLHQTSKSQVIFNVSGISNIPILEPGKSMTFFKPVSAHCTGNDCHLSIWHTDYDKGDGFFVSDAAGAYYNSPERTFEDRYPSFFDFGPNSRFVVNLLTHPRGRGASLTFENETGVFQVYIKQGDHYSLSSPGIFQVSASPYESVSFQVLSGSKVLLPTEFYNNPISGPIITMDKNGNIDKRDNDKDNFCFPAKENDFWKILKLVMAGFTLFVFLFSLISSFFICCSKNPEFEDQQLNKV